MRLHISTGGGTPMGYVSRVAVLAVSALAVQAAGAAVISTIQFATDRFAPNTVGVTAGDRLLWSLDLTSPDPCSAVSVKLSRGASGPFTMVLDSSPIFSSCNFSINSSVPFNPAAITGGPWTATATDSTGTTTALFPLIADPELLPFVTNIAPSDTGLTPTVNWTLPDLTGYDVDQIQFRVTRPGFGQILNQVLPASATSFAIPNGLLQDGQTYFFRVILRDLESTGLENRSNSYSNLVTVHAVPEPGVVALLGLSLAGLATARRRRRR